MKKRIFLSLSCIMLVLITGCGNKKEESVKKEETPSTNEVAYKDIYLEVLEDKRNYFNEGEEEITFSEYLKDYLERFSLTLSYAVLDMDKDGKDEMIVGIENTDEPYLILNYEDNIVYGYSITYRGMQNLKTDGTYQASGGADVNVVAYSNFNKFTRNETKLASSINGEYIVNNEITTLEEYNNFIKKFNEKENVSFTTYKSYEQTESTNINVGNYSLNYGTYYLELEDRTLAKDNSGTIILKQDDSCTFYEGMTDLNCVTYFVYSDEICFQVDGQDKYCFKVVENNKIGNSTGKTYIHSES